MANINQLAPIEPPGDPLGASEARFVVTWELALVEPKAEESGEELP